jgi:hypothetical protein
MLSEILKASLNKQQINKLRREINKVRKREVVYYELLCEDG